jgi:hypothetical protein
MYQIQVMPFRANMYAICVLNSDTNKQCKFMVGVDTTVSSVNGQFKSLVAGEHTLNIDSRSPTPGFAPKNEMNADEVKAEFDAMCDAIAADFKKSV